MDDPRAVYGFERFLARYGDSYIHSYNALINDVARWLTLDEAPGHTAAEDRLVLPVGGFNPQMPTVINDLRDIIAAITKDMTHTSVYLATPETELRVQALRDEIRRAFAATTQSRFGYDVYPGVGDVIDFARDQAFIEHALDSTTYDPHAFTVYYALTALGNMMHDKEFSWAAVMQELAENINDMFDREIDSHIPEFSAQDIDELFAKEFVSRFAEGMSRAMRRYDRDREPRRYSHRTASVLSNRPLRKGLNVGVTLPAKINDTKEPSATIPSPPFTINF
jgi:hypothetical protein